MTKPIVPPLKVKKTRKQTLAWMKRETFEKLLAKKGKKGGK